MPTSRFPLRSSTVMQGDPVPVGVGEGEGPSEGTVDGLSDDGVSVRGERIVNAAGFNRDGDWQPVEP